MASVATAVFQAVTHAIRGHAEAAPDRTAIVMGGKELSYGHLWQQIVMAADWYRSRGIVAGDRVVIAINDADSSFPAAYFGLHLVGGIAVPTSAKTTADDIDKRMETLEAKLLVAGDELDALRSRFDAGDGPAAPPVDVAKTASDDLADIMFTTGSTGEPKAVVLTHQNISASATLMAEFIGNTREDSEVVTLPLGHSFGLGRMRSVLLTGGKLTFVPGLVFPQVAIQAMLDQKATGLSCVPAGIRILLARVREGLESISGQLRYIEMGSAPLDEEEKRDLCTLFPDSRICMHYGLTEASRSAFLEFHSDKEHLASVGRATPGIEIRVADDTSTPVRAGEIGRILVRGPNVMPYYWRDRETATTPEKPGQRWIDTRDLGYLDGEDYLHLSGRADGVINCGGVNMLPEDIEAVATGFPGVLEAGCCGVADPEGLLGEIPRLCVVADGDLNTRDLADYVQANYAAALPRLIVDRIAELPRTESGKILRHTLKTIDERL